MKNYCILDIETTPGDFSRIPDSFELLLAGLKYEDQHSLYTAGPDQMMRLARFLDNLNMRNETLVTFNGRHFDLPILNKHMMDVLGRPLPDVARHYDILWECTKAAGHRISLAILAQLNLGYSKSPWNHLKNRETWAENPHLLIEYNRGDVDLTQAIYEIILARKPLNVGVRNVTLNPNSGIWMAEDV